MKKTVVQNTPNFGLCVDWETSGAIWGGDSSKDYQGIQAGVIVFDTKTFEPVEKLKLLIKFDSSRYQWTDSAQKIHGITRERLEAEGIDQQEAAAQFLELILKYWGPDGKVMFLGHNHEFDRRFTNQLTQSLDVEFSVEKTTDAEGWIQMHHVQLDTAALGFITLGLFKSDLIFERIGFEAREDHDAMTDAEQTLQTCQAIRALVDFAFSSMEAS